MFLSHSISIGLAIVDRTEPQHEPCQNSTAMPFYSVCIIHELTDPIEFLVAVTPTITCIRLPDNKMLVNLTRDPKDLCFPKTLSARRFSGIDASP